MKKNRIRIPGKHLSQPIPETYLGRGCFYLDYTISVFCRKCVDVQLIHEVNRKLTRAIRI
jgi:hypothetical protein